MDGFYSLVAIFPKYRPPAGWMPCEGQVLPVSSRPDLVAAIGFTFSGNGSTTFALPDLRGVPLPQGLAYYIAMDGRFPSMY